MGRSNRLPPPFGLLIDRSRPIRFTFEGKAYQGYAGDTIASALAANGHWILSRSFKYHRPRGIFSLDGADANALVQVGPEPNVPADATAIAEGLEIRGQNYAGSLEHDRNAILGRLSRFLPVGFYYRTFFAPGRDAWTKLWEPIIRRKAGLGRLATDQPARRYDRSYLFKDVVVVGGGPAGLAAALAAADTGADVLLADDKAVLGGTLAFGRFDAAGERGERERRRLIAEVSARPNIEVMTGATCNGWFADNWLPIIHGDRLYKTRAAELVLATGAIEQPAIFRNNDLPGIMLGTAAQRLIRLYGVRPGQRAVVFTATDRGYGVALDLIDAGVELAVVIELRHEKPTSELAAALADRGIQILTGHGVVEAAGSAGHRYLRRVRVAPIDAADRPSEGGRWLDCDLLCVSIGEMPAWQLPLQAGGRLVWAEDRRRFVVAGLPPHVTVAGSVEGETETQPPAWPIFPHPKGKEFVDFDEDLQIADIRNTVAEGYREIELVKRFSTVGMGPSQGRYSALVTAHLVAEATQRSVGEVGVTTARPPVVPEKLGVLAGRPFQLERRTPMHDRHIEFGAHMARAGQWLLPSYYGEARERAVRAEVASALSAVALADVSAQARFELRGPDAGRLLDRLYASSHADQPSGCSRPFLMTNEIGSVVDMGVVHRLEEDRFRVVSSASATERAFRPFLEWKARSQLDVDLAELSGSTAGMALRGLKARTLFARLFSGIDLASAAVYETRMGGVSLLLSRGPAGDIFEIEAPASVGEAVWDEILETGRDLGIHPYGTAVADVLRIADGRIALGQDSDALSTPAELGLEGEVARERSGFIGARAVAFREQVSFRRLVAFTVDEPNAALPQIADLVMRGEAPIGRVTSLCRAPSDGSIIGFAYATVEEAAGRRPIHIRLGTGDIVEARLRPRDPINDAARTIEDGIPA